MDSCVCKVSNTVKIQFTGKVCTVSNLLHKRYGNKNYLISQDISIRLFWRMHMNISHHYIVGYLSQKTLTDQVTQKLNLIWTA